MGRARLVVAALIALVYEPRALIRVMEVLAKASGGSRQPEFFSTHPAPENRVERIKQAIAKSFPNGVPEGLKR